MAAISNNKAKEFIDKQPILSVESFGWKMFSITQKCGKAMVGEVGLFTSSDDPSKADIGWWIKSQHCQQGIASEAAKSLFEW